MQPRSVPRKAFCNYYKNADVHDYIVHTSFPPKIINCLINSTTALCKDDTNCFRYCSVAFPFKMKLLYLMGIAHDSSALSCKMCIIIFSL